MCFTPWSPIGQALAVVGESIYEELGYMFRKQLIEPLTIF